MTDVSGPRTLSPAVRTAWTMEAQLYALAIVGISIAAEVFGPARLGSWPLAPGVGAVGMAGLAFGWAIIYPRLRYACWSFRAPEEGLQLDYGVIWKTRRSIPRARIQHVDVHSGPIDRLFGIVSLTVFTAGTAEVAASIPGLRPEVAEFLRERLLAPADRHE